jgi:peptide/nickel transport system permease protein
VKDYLIKRLLIMIPTFLGVSLMLFVVMAAAPGEPSSMAGSQDPGASADTLANVTDLEAQNRNVRMFRRQFNLDRPLFFNDWTKLEAAEVRAALEEVRDGALEAGPQAYKDAKRSLEDWSHYAVPPLVEVLETSMDDPELQDRALRYLRQGAYRFRTIYPSGYKRTPDDIARDREIDRENLLLNQPQYGWAPGADRAKRAAVVAAWRAWLDERSERFSYDFGDRVRVGLSDTQFGKYWGNLFQGDLGLSNIKQEPVLGMILSRLKYSLSLAVPAFLIAWILAVFLGVFSATQHNKPVDQGVGMGLFMLYSIPTFVAATLLQKWLCVEEGLFPLSGFESAEAKDTMTTWEHFLDVLEHITLPLIVYTYGSLAYISRQARSGMLEVLKSDFVRTARAKGVPERHVVWRHAVRNGMMPIVTLLGTALPVLLAGSVFIEVVFNIDGFGRLMVESIIQKDYNVVMGIQLIVAVLTLIGLLLTDLIYAAMDPRISYK